jgi:hypothetical protein
MTNPAPIARFIHGTNVDESVFERNVRSALFPIGRGFRDFYPRCKHLTIAGGGPSLNDLLMTGMFEAKGHLWALNNVWREMIGGHRVDAVVIMDARPTSIEFVDPDVHIVDVAEWMIASQCDPDVLENMSDVDAEVTIWHAAGPKIIEQLGLHGIRGGGTVLSRAINLAWERGFRDFTLAGVDSSITAEAHHAYPQAINDQDKRIEVETPKGARFITTPELAEQATTVFRQMREYEKIGGSFRIIADGLLPTLWAEFKADFPNGELTNV